MKTLRATVAAAAIALSPVVADAASIDLGAFGYEAITGTDVPVVADTMDVALFGATLLSSDLATSSTTFLDSFDLGVPIEAGFSHFGLGALDSVSALGATSVEVMTDSIEFLFEGVFGEGVFSGLDGGALLVTLSAADITLFDVYFGPADLEAFHLTAVPTSPIPLPAGLPLLATGLLGMGILARRRRSS